MVSKLKALVKVSDNKVILTIIGNFIDTINFCEVFTFWVFECAGICPLVCINFAVFEVAVPIKILSVNYKNNEIECAIACPDRK